MAGSLGLRWGELIGLHRRYKDLDHGAVRVRRAVTELNNGQREIKAPKSAAVNARWLSRLRSSPTCACIWSCTPNMVSVGRSGVRRSQGAIPRHNHFNRLWRKACSDAGIEGLHFRDLRHAGSTL